MVVGKSFISLVQRLKDKSIKNNYTIIFKWVNKVKNVNYELKTKCWGKQKFRALLYNQS